MVDRGACPSSHWGRFLFIRNFSIGFIMDERMMKWFRYEHLPDQLQETSKKFHSLAFDLVESIESGPERTVALRKLLEAKDAAVRAKLNPGC
jgi:hypothetical protein